MKMFYAMMVLVLLGALALPFFMKGPNGKPIMTMEKMVGESVLESVSSLRPSEPVEIYRWQDEHGVWQFGEAIPDNVPVQQQASRLIVDDSRTTSLGSEWDLTEVVSQSQARDPVDFKMPNTLTDAYRAAPELMEATQRAAGALNSRQGGMDELLEQINQNYNN